MIEEKGDIWNYYGQPKTVICITTNGTIKNNGECVMGRGNALQAKLKIKGLALELGNFIRIFGNKVHSLDMDKILSFPVKHNFWEKADLDLIKKSAQELNEQTLKYPHFTFYLPRPGCSNGKRTWEEVKPLLTFLPDNVKVITLF